VSFPDDMPLGDAREWLRERVEHGARCPLCTQYAKVYERKLNSRMARQLITFWRKCGSGPDFHYAPDVLDGDGTGDFAKLVYWELIEPLEGERDDGSTRVGWWRVTDDGAQFVLGRVVVPKHARVYDSQCLKVTGELVGIRDCLGERFNYRELMGW